MLSSLLTLAEAVESSDRAVIATDDAGAVVYWGSGAEALYGWTEPEALGRDIVDVTPGELSRAEAEAIMRQLKNGEPWLGEFVVRAKDGTRFPVHVTDVPIYDGSGHLAGIIGISRRITYLSRR